MDRNIQNELARRLLAHANAATTDIADRQMHMPTTEYLDRGTWEEEVAAVFKRKPIAVGLSCEVPEIGSFLSLTIVDTPILITRTDEGLKAFLNVCRHRGAMVAPKDCNGRRTRFSCPYHGWTYDNKGRLLAVADARTFGPVDAATHGLTEIAVAERSGVLFVVLTPGVGFDAETWMAGVDRHMGLDDRRDDYELVGSRTVKAANWKLVVEGHLESYHFAQLHRESVGQFMVNNCTVFDRFGPHILIAFCQKTIDQLKNLPEDQWEPLRDEMINPQYLMFPSTMVTIWESAIIAQVIQPGAEPGTSISRLVYGIRKSQSDDPEQRARSAAMLDMVANLVQDEDYWASFQIQRGLQTGAQDEIVFGQNEIGLMMFHESLQNQRKTA